MPLLLLYEIERLFGRRRLLDASIGSRLKYLIFSLLILAAVCHASLLHDLSYKELNDRSFSLNGNFASVASAQDLYDLNEAQQVRIPRHMQSDRRSLLRQYQDLITATLKTFLNEAFIYC